MLATLCFLTVLTLGLVHAHRRRSLAERLIDLAYSASARFSALAIALDRALQTYRQNRFESGWRWYRYH
jgi:hypothetical protein